MVFLLCGKIVIISVAKVPNFVDIGRDTFLSFCHFDWMHQHAIIVSTLEFAERSIRRFIHCRNNLNLTIVVLPTNYLVRAYNKNGNRVYNLTSVLKVIFMVTQLLFDRCWFESQVWMNLCSNNTCSISISLN